jgi:hypothetical protein
VSMGSSRFQGAVAPTPPQQRFHPAAPAVETPASPVRHKHAYFACRIG